MPRPKNIRDGLPRFWNVFRHFLPAIRRERALVAGAMVSLFASVLFRLLEPWPLKFVLDAVIRGKGARHAGWQWISGMQPTTILTLAAVAIVLFTSFRAMSDYYKSIGFAILGNRVMEDVRNKLYAHLQSLSMAFHNNARGGDLLVRMIGDIKLLRDVAVTALLPLVASSMILVGMISVMFLVNWKLTLLALSILPLFALSTLRLTGKIHSAARQQRKREGDMSATAAESIAAMQVVQALSLEETFSSGFSSQNKKSLKEGVKTRRLAAKLQRAVDILVAVATAMVLWYGGYLTLEGAMTAGELVVFLTYLKRGLRPLQDFAKYTARIAKATAAGERVVEILDHVPDIQDLPGAIVAPPFRGALAVQEVSFAYDAKAPVLKDISFQIQPGSKTAIVGPSGCGKSTLLSMFLRMIDPDEGAIEFDGQNIKRYKLDSLRGQISIVLQDTVLFAANVWENIAFGGSEATKEQIVAAAELAGAAEFIDSLPEKYETVLGERGATLSRGQRQRIAIARAAIRNAPILLLDEPLSGLDEQSEQIVRSGLKRLSRGKTTVFVTHDLNDALNADTIIHIEHGTLLEMGSPQALLTSGGRFMQLFEGQQSYLKQQSLKKEQYAKSSH